MNDVAGARAPLDQVAHWLRQHWRFILLSLVGWTLLAAIPTTSAYIGSGAPGIHVWWTMFSAIGFYYYLWGIVTPLLYRLVDRLPYRGRGRLLTIPVHAVTLATISFTFGFIAHPDNWRDWLLGERALGYHAMSLFTYLLVVLLCFSLKFYRLSLLREREASASRVHAAELDAKLNLARVDSLRMQMNPHFLFNALNSIAALVESGRSDRAYEAVEELGDLLRRALNLTRQEDVPLDDELEFCRAYLALEQLRYESRLVIEWKIDDAARSIPVPAFVMQPLIENAIKHGVAPSTTPVSVRIEARLDASRLRLRVADDGAAADAASGPGLGLANLRQRLLLRYGDHASLVSGPNAGGFATALELPASTTGDKHEATDRKRS